MFDNSNYLYVAVVVVSYSFPGFSLSNCLHLGPTHLRHNESYHHRPDCPPHHHHRCIHRSLCCSSRRNCCSDTRYQFVLLLGILFLVSPSIVDSKMLGVFEDVQQMEMKLLSCFGLSRCCCGYGRIFCCFGRSDLSSSHSAISLRCKLLPLQAF